MKTPAILTPGATKIGFAHREMPAPIVLTKDERADLIVVLCAAIEQYRSGATSADGCDARHNIHWQQKAEHLLRKIQR